MDKKYNTLDVLATSHEGREYNRDSKMIYGSLLKELNTVWVERN